MRDLQATVYYAGMFPTLFALGPVVIKSLNVFLVIALMAGLFVFWRKGREEHYDEMELFDVLFVSLLVGIVAGRVAFVALNWQYFWGNWLGMIDIFAEPGITMFAVFVASAVYVLRVAHQKKWDEFEILDFWSLGVAWSAVFVWIGNFFSGAFVGQPTTLPFGVQFPGLFEKHHPIQLYFAVWYVVVALYLGWAEFRYRTFPWYRAGKSTAQTGFLLSVLMITTGLAGLVISLVSFGPLEYYGVRLDTALAALLVVAGSVLLFARSGRELPFIAKRHTAKRISQFTVPD
jgi:phosphatidylglycerol:prolipoprotein diacylglycerol transferase